MTTVMSTPLSTVIARPMAGVAPARLAADDTLVALGNPDVVRRYWVPDGIGVNPNGYVSEDDRPSAAVRFVNRYAPNAMITVHFYVVDMREQAGHPTEHAAPFIVGEMIEYFIAKDPIVDRKVLWAEWSDSTFAYASDRMATEAKALMVRDRLAAKQSALGVGERFYWNGTPQ